MKKLLLCLLSFFALSTGAAEDIPFNVGWDDPTSNGYPTPKVPIRTPSVSLDDHTVYFYTPCDGDTLRLVDENDVVVYTLVIPTGTTSLVLPATLSGEFEIQIISGCYCFWGVIEL